MSGQVADRRCRKIIEVSTNLEDLPARTLQSDLKTARLSSLRESFSSGHSALDEYFLSFKRYIRLSCWSGSSERQIVELISALLSGRERSGFPFSVRHRPSCPSASSTWS